MGQTLREQRVTCHRCRYRFPVHVQPDEDWRVEAQCPSCEGWACFTVADTNNRAAPNQQELDAATQRLGEQLWRPINQHRSHPATAWLDCVGNGVFEDDQTPKPWCIPTWVYRFRRGSQAAYIWQQGDCWLVRRWYSPRGGQPPEPAELFSFAAALDVLVR